jgi:ribosomal protein S18 acetylase RimI-like enzyme
MSSRDRSGDPEQPGVSTQSGSQPASALGGPLQKNEIRIREGRLKDEPQVASLMCELGYETTPAEMETRLKAISSNPAYKTFVAVVDGRVWGMIGTIICPSYEHNDPGGRILALVTSRAARRRGIGRALVAAAEKDFAQKGITRVALNTQLTREDAHRFYESLGYERNGWRFVKQLW